MADKEFTKALKALFTGTLLLMAFTRGNARDWLVIGFTAVWLLCMTVYLCVKSGRREAIPEQRAEEDPEQEEPEPDFPDEEETDPVPNPSDAEVWYRMIGSQLLTDAITDLNTRGIKKLEIRENGEIVVSDQTVDTIDALPGRALWDTLAGLMRDDGLTADVGNDEILISW